MMKYGRLWAGVAIVLASASAAFAQKPDKAVQADGRRAFYLTKTDWIAGADALTACAPGFHMASVWELLEPSSLKYDTTLGQTKIDSGFGPPTERVGFVRTGAFSTGADTDGANCHAWTSSSYLDRGTVMGLFLSNGTATSRMDPWVVSRHPCHNASEAGIWCVQD